MANSSSSNTQCTAAASLAVSSVCDRAMDDRGRSPLLSLGQAALEPIEAAMIAFVARHGTRGARDETAPGAQEVVDDEAFVALPTPHVVTLSAPAEVSALSLSLSLNSILFSRMFLLVFFLSFFPSSISDYFVSWDLGNVV
jgi:hypothetical protein